MLRALALLQPAAAHLAVASPARANEIKERAHPGTTADRTCAAAWIQRQNTPHSAFDVLPRPRLNQLRDSVRVSPPGTSELQPRQHPEMELSLAPGAPNGWEGTVASVFLSLAPIWLFGIVTGYMVSGAATPLRSGCNSQGTRLKVWSCTGRSCRGLAPSTCPTCCCLARA